jgi:subtilisin family serine protease
VVSLSQNEKINKGNIEVVVLFGNNLDKVVNSVNKIGGVFENLGFGFGIVTVKAEDILKVSQLEGVQYVELPKVLFTSDFESNKAACVPSVWDRYGLTGEGTLVGFIDTGIDYTHPAFKDEEGNTRIEFIYDLGENRKVYDKAQINEALKASDPYNVVNVRDPAEHGTHVAGIACAGGKIPKQNYGVAFKSSIAMVKVTREGFLNFALSTQIMRGIKFLIDKANELNKPLTINISLSTNDGAHNGTSLLEQYIETICRLERVAMVIAAGNDGDAAHHVGGELAEENNISLSVSDSEPSLLLQLYKPLLVNLSIVITNPLGQKSGEIILSEGYKELNIGTDKCIIYNTGPKPFDISGEITISFLATSDYIASGEWKLTLKVLNKYRGIYDMWLPISEALSPKTKFLQPNVYNTLGIPATVQSAISVGSYNSMTNSFSSFSGRGKLYRTSFIKPDLVAPGEEILSTVPEGGFDTKSGTSMAAPHVAGVCALLLEWGVVRGNDPFLYGDRLKYYLSKEAKKNRTEIIYPDPSWGYGIVCAYDTLELLKLASVRSNEMSIDNIKNEFNRQKVSYALIEYHGDLVNAVSKIENAQVYVLDKDRAVLITLDRNVDDVIEELGNIVIYKSIPDIYTLCQVLPTKVAGVGISPTEAAGVGIVQSSSYLSLNGSGTIIGIVDTGIDYLNEEFMNQDGTSRIVSIFDQGNNSGKKVQGQPTGSEFTKEDINAAIKAKREGRDPYEIVPSRDEIGHGTNMAGIIAARGLNPGILMGVAPACEIAVVKLITAEESLKEEFCVYGNEPAYSSVAVFLGIKYLFDLGVKLKKPIVIFVPLGSNMGPHNGLAFIERYIDEISKTRGIVVVVPTGNEGEAATHTSGVIAKEGDTDSIELRIDKEQKNLRFEIWVTKPDKMSLSIVSPSGEIVERIPPKTTKEATEINFIYEGTQMFIQYSIPEEITGDERIVVTARNIREGIWIFNIIGDLISVGIYDAWLPQREILAPGTVFIIPDNYITLTIPSTSREAISVSYYDQTKNTIVAASGRGFTRSNDIKPDLAAGGINAVTTATGGGIKVISGSSVAAAVVAGCALLILEWGIIKGNDRGMYATKVKTYLIRGTSKREGDVYPNQQWGYGTVNMRGVMDNIRGLKNIEVEEAPKTRQSDYFTGSTNRNLLIEYKGDIVSAIKRFPNTATYIIDDKRAAISLPYEDTDRILRLTPEVVYADPGEAYTLCAITPIEASQAILFHENIYLPLDGTGVIIGIVDTGIDYLNEEFINEDGTSKIMAIWDQTINVSEPPEGLIAGSLYTQEDINKAIQAKRKGEDPYTIVPSKDEIGHGTNMAGILAARGVNPGFIGVAPKSNLLVVKLNAAPETFRIFGTIYGDQIVYRSVALFLGIKFLYDFASKLNKPIVIYVPLGTNEGSHTGESYIERYIEEISTYSGVVVVVPTGNQGNSNTHTSGVLKSQGDIAIIELNIGKNQKDIRLFIWISKPDKVSLSITSPTGEVIRRVPPKIKEVSDITFIYEETRMIIEYFIPEEITGEEKILITARNIKEGVWQFKLIGDFIVVGKYDVWILQRDLIAPDTKFFNASPYTTLTIPSTASSAISVAFYNQNNNAIEPASGRGYTRNNIIKPDIAAGGINQITTSVGGGTQVVSGSSVAGAVVAGACALILEWGIIKGNDTTMFASKVKTYLTRGAAKRPGDVYPNPQWGYGMLDVKGVFDNIRGLENIEKREIPPNKMINYFLAEDSRSIVVEYKGDIVGAIKKYPNTEAYIIDKRRALLSLPYGESDRILRTTPEIVYADPGSALTLCDISPVEASETTVFHNNVYLPLSGLGVIIGIVDTGIDYLNEEFINEDGTTRILTIWDHTIEGGSPSAEIPIGVVYTEEDINKALEIKRNGGDPYSVVPSKDDIGHGTHIAGIAAARGANPELVGAAPRCSLAIVKLRPGTKAFREYYAIYGNEVAYINTGVFLGLKFLNSFASKLKKPIVLLIPLGTNMGAHNGESLTERYINEISQFSGVVVVAPTGNQGNSDTHTTGVISNIGDTGVIELRIGKNQKDIRIEIWVSKPDKVSLSITSPTGEVTRKIVPKLKEVSNINFVYERTQMTIEYFIPEEITGDQKIIITARGIKEGIWQFRLIGDLIVVGKYDSWILQKELLAPDTKFLNPNKNTTLTLPATAQKAISVAYYNQNNNSIVPQSGNGYTRNNMIKPDIAAGGINAITTTVGGGTKVISGSSVAAAVVAGACALILQWGIVDGNDTTMYSSKVKTYLIRGTTRRPGDVYPNPQWGYGMLNMKGTFDNIRLLGSEDYEINSDSNTEELSDDKEYYIGSLFIRLPKSISK